MTTGVIRLEANGPGGTGLERMDLDAADFQSPLPHQSVHVYFNDDNIGLSVGVWTTSDMQEAFGPYTGDAFMPGDRKAARSTYLRPVVSRRVKTTETAIRTSEVSTISVPTALISGVTPRRIVE